MEHITQALARAFNSVPTNDEAQSTPHAPGPFDQQAHLNFDSALQKRQATFTAKLALAGYSLLELSDKTFLVSRWDRSRHLADLQAVAAFLRQIGGAT